MDEVSANPIFVVLFFVLRCAIPLLLMLGVTALLRKFGLIAPAPQDPDEIRPKPETKGNSKGAVRR